MHRTPSQVNFGLIACWIICMLPFSVRGNADEQEVVEKASQYLSRVTSGDSTGVAVLIARDGKILYEGGAGFADLSKKVAITSKTKFRIGSISKQFTAAAILLLAEQNKLSLDDELTKYFPDFPNAKGVRLHHLLTHTSGLHSYTEKPDFYSRVAQAVEPQAMLDWFKNDPPDFAPGAGFHYCNTGYFLLGEIAAKVSGMSFASYLQENIFDPLEMRNTGTFVNTSPPENMATGYSWNEGKYDVAMDWDMSWATGAGALYSTVGDLFLWNEALYTGRVLNEDSFKAAVTPVKLPENVDGMNYGYGLTMYEIGRLPVVGHGGGLNGWSTDLLRLPEQRCTIAVLSNAQPSAPELEPHSISQIIVEKLFAEEISKMPAFEEDPTITSEVFKDFVGRYDYQGAILTVTVQDAHLFAQLTSQPKAQIYPQSKDEYFWKVAAAQVKFLRDERGEVIAARHTQNGNSFTAPKLGDEKVNLSAEQLERFVGKYQYGPAAVMTVSREETQLYAQLTGQPKFPIFPKSETEFEWRVVVAEVEFVSGDKDAVVSARHTQNGITFDAPKLP